jgi:pantothenate kinase
LVGDIYGDSCEQSLGLPASLLASSVGKSIQQQKEAQADKLDYMKSVIMMLAINLSNISALVAQYE